MIEFKFRTGKITIDHALCAACQHKDCVPACEKWGTTLYKLENGLPVLVHSIEETGRRCIEDLSCEIYCHQNGNKGLTIHLDMFGLDEYVARMTEKQGTGSKQAPGARSQ